MLRGGVQKTLRGGRVRVCRRGRTSPGALPDRRVLDPQRQTERGNRIDVALLRAFLKRTLEDDAIADAVNDLLFEHIVAGRYHRSVVAENLPAYIDEVLRAATPSDWQAVADELIAEAREVNGEV
jgi:hypothetical protein